MGRPTKIELPAPDTSTVGSEAETTYEYNRLNRIMRKREHDPVTGTSWNGTSGGRTTTFAYTFNTVLHHTIMTATEPPLNGAAVVSKYTFDHHGNLVSVLDPLNRKTDYKYNHFHELDQIRVLGTGATAIQQTDYGYDTLGRLTSIKRLVTGTAGGGLPPTVSSPSSTVSVNTAVTSQEVDLSAIFGDAEDSDSALRLVVESNSNPNLFESIAITQSEPRKLVLRFADGVTTPTGTPAAIQIRGYDTQGASVLHTLNVDRSTASTTSTLVNSSYSTGPQTTPRVATFNDGSYVVIWQGDGAQAAGGIYGRLYKPDGTPNGNAFLISQDTTKTHYYPSVASNGTSYVVSWIRTETVYPEEGYPYEVYRGYVRFFLGSTPQTSEIQVYYDSPHFDRVEVDSLTDGRFLVAWRAMDPSYSNYILQAQIYNGNGTATTPPIIVNLAGYGDAEAYSVGATADGDFLLSWRYGTNLYACRYTSDGVAVGNVVNVSLVSGVTWTVTADGGFVVAWHQNNGIPATDGVYIRRFGVDGTPVANPYYLGAGQLGWIDATTDNSFAVARYNTSNEILLRRFDANGNPVGTESIVATGATSGQNSAYIAYLVGGAIALAYRAPGVGDDIYQRQIAISPPAPAAGTFRVLSVEPGANMVGPIDRLLLTFSDPVDLATLQAAGAVTLLGATGTPIVVTSIESVTRRQYNVRFAAQSAMGNYTLTLGPGITKQGTSTTLGEAHTQVFHLATPAMRKDGPGQTGELASEVEFKFDYDEIDRLEKITDPLNNETTFTYHVINPTGTFEHLKVTVARPVVGATEYWYDWYDRVGIVYVRSMHPTLPLAEYDYDAAGDLEKAFDALRNVTDFDYDARHRLVSMTEPAPAAGQPRPVTTYLYDTASQLLMESDPLGRQTGYRYNQLGQVRRLMRAKPDGTNAGLIVAPGDTSGTPIGPYTDFKYDATGNLRQMSEADAGAGSPVTEYQYDVSGNLKKITLPQPPTGPRPAYNYVYDVAGQLKFEADPLLRYTGYTYDGAGRTLSVTTFDSGSSGPGNTTSLAYDGLDNVVRVTDPLGRVTHYGYDLLSRPVSSIDALGGMATSHYDAAGRMTGAADELGRTTKYEYDPLDRLTKITHPHPSAAGAGPVDQYGYDLAGNLISSKGWNGAETIYKYDKLHRLEFVYQPNPQTGVTLDGLGQPVGPRTQFFYDAVGQLTQIKDPLDRYTAYGYDKLGRRTSVTLPNPTTGLATGPVTDYVYDWLDRLTEIKEADPDGSGLLPRSITRHVYDNLGRRTQLIEPDPVLGTATGPTTDFKYNLAGDLIETKEPSISIAGGATSRRTTEYQYDGHGRLKQETLGTGATSQTTLYTYDRASNLTTVRDAAGFTTFTTYDALDRPASVIDSREGTTRFGYDAVSNRTSLTDPSGNTTAFAYDRLDRLTRETNALSHARKYIYDAAGNLDKRVDREGRVRDFGYDYLNRQVKEEWFASLSDPTADRTFTYNLDGAGQLEDAQDAGQGRASDFDLNYDKLGRVKEVFWQMLGDLEGALHYEYDDLSRRTRVWMDYADVPETWRVTDFDNLYQYDAQSRLTRLTQSVHPNNTGFPVSEKRVDLTYNALDEFVSITRYNDLDGLPAQEVFTSTYQYDGLGRLTSLVHQKTGQPAINSYTFSYDVLNRLTSMSSKDGPSTFTYDSTGQLTSANHTNGTGLPADEGYVHDLNGNRVSATAGSSSSAYATGTNNQLLSDGTYNYSYDLEGNRTGRTRISDGQFTEYRYDHLNQLVFVGTKTSASAPTYTSRVQMVYDLFGRRFQKLVDSDGDGDWDSQSGYVSDGMHVALEYIGSSLADANFVRRYLHGPAIDQVLAQEEIITFISLTYWMAPDHLGTVRDMTNNAGTAIVHATFSAFGQLINVDNPQGVPYLFGFTGREWDAETGLWYYRARYYDANTGRFLQEDPLGFAAGDTNLARYVGNGPTNATDPSGLAERPGRRRPSLPLSNVTTDLDGRIPVSPYSEMTYEEILLDLSRSMEGLQESLQPAELQPLAKFNCIQGYPNRKDPGRALDDMRWFFWGMVRGVFVDLPVELGSTAWSAVRHPVDTFIGGPHAMGEWIGENVYDGDIWRPEDWADEWWTQYSSQHPYDAGRSTSKTGVKIAGGAVIARFPLLRSIHEPIEVPSPRHPAIDPCDNPPVTPNWLTGEGYGVNDPPVRIEGEWSADDFMRALRGRSPRGLGRPDLHHAGQMPGSAIHEIIPPHHRNNPALHPNRFNQGVTDEMRRQNRELHWWYRAREMGADALYPDLIFD